MIAATVVAALVPASAFAVQSRSDAEGKTTTRAAAPTQSLGARYSSVSTTFRIWSPGSSAVSVTVNGTSYPMAATPVAGYTGVYQAVVAGDLNGRSYQFAVGGRNVPDPYARMVEPGTRRGVVVDDAAITPSAGKWYPTPALTDREDSIVYELDVRDFTVDASSGVDADRRGKYLGLVQTGTTYRGVATGIDHLKELGITHVQLMPTQDFLSSMYNWGYDPVNYSVPEEQYSQFSTAADRVREFKDMVNEFHRNGIRVTMDVVFNHTGSADTFRGITGSYYTPTDLSGTGNSIDDSNPMVSRMIRDSLEVWVRDYHVDGFRFDLLGVHQYRNAAEWGTYLNGTYPDRNLLIYGEPWNGAASDPDENQKVRYRTVPALTASHIGVFNGSFRDAVRGGTKDTVIGYMGGTGDASAIALGMKGSPLKQLGTQPLSDTWDPAFAGDPEQTINYVSVHDDLNLYDKITHTGATGDRAERIDRLAVGIVLTSQGIPLIAEGDEFLRSKVVGGDYTTASNSYRAGDQVNAVHWGDKITNQNVNAYYRALFSLRRTTPSLRLTSWDAISTQQRVTVAGQVVTSRISSRADAPTDYDTVVVVNPTTGAQGVTLPDGGTWTKTFDSRGITIDDRTAASAAVTVFRRS
ncbi:alpha-amylase family glycosyl hydrolase [Kineosporia mesophila]|uniref:alpha-amylase family glycosyl hydrolase n=1 Tax=Kineosporia mesophila TaxID=566012 RepID=UPI001E425497|nr:alpha-amylase family glycosyl hydrolase [Kineosporia mesophila]MCD5352446.1 hypothetical protein [Kineosporia mesophila]